MTRAIVPIAEVQRIVDVPEEVIKVVLKDTDFDFEGETDTLKPVKLPMTKSAQKYLCKLLRVPGDFYHRSNPEVRQAILKQALHTSPLSAKLVTRQKEVVRIMNPDDIYHSPREVFTTTIETLDNSEHKLIGAMDPCIDDDMFQFSFVTDKTGHPPTRVGDLTHTGIGVTYQEVAFPRLAFNLEISAYLYRLACTNGMVSHDSFDFSIRKTNGDFKAGLADAVLKASNFAHTIFLTQFTDLDSKKITNPSQFLSRLVDENRLGKKQLTDLIMKLASLPKDATAYDIVNMVTEHGNSEKPRTRHNMQKLGGLATSSLHSHRCSNCYQPVSAN